jgi:hypothetical protein
MDEIRPNTWNDVVDYLSLKGKGDLRVFIPIIGVDTIHVEKGPVFGKVNPIIGHYLSNGVYVLFENRG